MRLRGHGAWALLLVAAVAVGGCADERPLPNGGGGAAVLRPPPQLQQRSIGDLSVRIIVGERTPTTHTINAVGTRDDVDVSVPSDEPSTLRIYWYERYVLNGTVYPLPLGFQRLSVRAGQTAATTDGVPFEHEFEDADPDARIPRSVAALDVDRRFLFDCEIATTYGDPCSFDTDGDGVSNFAERTAETPTVPVRVLPGIEILGDPEPPLANVEAGCFAMDGGSPADAGGAYTVCLPAYRIARARVTSDAIERYWHESLSSTTRRLGRASDGSVTGLDWNDAVGYARWLSATTGVGYRLPTEAELTWYLAAAIDETKAFPSRSAAAVREWTCSDYRRHVDGSEQACSPDVGAADPFQSAEPKSIGGPLPRQGLGTAARRSDVGFRLARD